MERTLLAGLGLLGVLAAPAWAQESADSPKADVKQLIEQLGDPSYKQRKSAEDSLRAHLDEARGALEAAAKESADPEVRWRAQRLLRSSDRDRSPLSLRRRGPDAQPRGSDRAERGLTREFDDIFGQLERDFGIDIPRQRFFGDEFFRDLQEQMKAMQGLQGGQGLGQSMQMQVGPDGVTVKVKETNENGEVEEKSYQAPDLESFRQQYPDVADRYLGGRGGLGLRWNFHSPQGLPRLAPHGMIDRPDLNPMPAPPVASNDGPKLGVYVRELSPDVRAFLGLDDGQGLVIEQVLDDSLAQSLKLEEGDVVCEVNGHKVFGVEDVAAALRDAGEKVEVSVNRHGATMTLSADKPATKDADEGKVKPDGGSSKLRKRTGTPPAQIK